MLEADATFLTDHDILRDADQNATHRCLLWSFARLLVLLRDDSNLRHKFIRSRGTLARSELDAKRTLEAFWEEGVMPKFNSIAFQP